MRFRSSALGIEVGYEMLGEGGRDMCVCVCVCVCMRVRVRVLICFS